MGRSKKAELERAMAECRRFPMFAGRAILRDKNEGDGWNGNTREMGRVKRASLDLSQRLAEFRKTPQWIGD